MAASLTHVSSLPLSGFTIFGLDLTNSPQGVTCSSDNSSLYITLTKRILKVPRDWDGSSPPLLTSDNVLSHFPKYSHVGAPALHSSSSTLLLPLESPTLKGIVASFSLDLEYQSSAPTSQAHLPWVAVDADSSLVYSSEYDDVSSLSSYALSDLSPAAAIPLDAAVPLLGGVQGGAMWNGELFLSMNDEPLSIYRVDVRGDGAVSFLASVEEATGLESMARNFFLGAEMEGLAFCGSGDDVRMLLVVGTMSRFMLLFLGVGLAIAIALLCIALAVACRKPEIDTDRIKLVEDASKTNPRSIVACKVFATTLLAAAIGFGVSFGVVGQFVARGQLLEFIVEQ
jgi:hypothetical protein